MTRKDYQLIADAIRDTVELHRRQFGDRWPLDGTEVVASIADALGVENPRFDRSRFLDAAGFTETFTFEMVE